MDSTARYRNATYALVAGLNELLTNGERLNVRGSEILELRNHISVLRRPRERCIITPKRNNNIFATIAETVWVMAGRNDLAYLAHYLPRAGDFSDDGATWRAGYGPRLRSWHGIDQLSEVVRLLRSELSTRRAVMAIFDPAIDYQDSKDIPCNNWLDWLVRNGNLHLTVALRSNDAVWGFSGINSFEWSVLQEMLAHWIGAEVGDATFLASSFHLYTHHEARAGDMVKSFPDTTWYDYGATAPKFATEFEKFDDMLERWFAIESRLRAVPEACDAEISRFPDPLYRQFLAMLQLYNGMKRKWNDHQVAQCLMQLPENDLTAAAYEYISRQRPSVMPRIDAHPTIHRWLAACPPTREDRTEST